MLNGLSWCSLRSIPGDRVGNCAFTVATRFGVWIHNRGTTLTIDAKTLRQSGDAFRKNLSTRN